MQGDGPSLRRSNGNNSAAARRGRAGRWGLGPDEGAPLRARSSGLAALSRPDDRLQLWRATARVALEVPKAVQQRPLAFESLLGLDVSLTSADDPDKPPQVVQLEKEIDDFATFMLAVQLPPNPVKPLDNVHGSSARLGKAFFSGARRADGMGPAYDIPNNRNGTAPDGRNCEGCHTLDPARGLFGTGGDASHGGEVLILKVPHLRNLYQKVGMFGLPNREYFLPSPTDAHQGDQIRGFGFLHDGATDQLFHFLQGAVFDDGSTTCADLGLPRGGRFGSVFGCDFNDGMNIGIPDNRTRQGLVDYLMEFDTDLAPVVGQQVTLHSTNAAAANPRIDLLLRRAATPFESFVLGPGATECDVVVKGLVSGKARGWVRLPDGSFKDDLGDIYTDAAVRNQATREGPLTYTCTPPGSGVRIGIDRDRDTVLDGLDNCPAVWKVDQADSTGDGVGDACSPSLESGPARRSRSNPASRALDPSRSHGFVDRHEGHSHG